MCGELVRASSISLFVLPLFKSYQVDNLFLGNFTLYSNFFEIGPSSELNKGEMGEVEDEELDEKREEEEEEEEEGGAGGRRQSIADPTGSL